ncbi:hypothetical protein XI08_01575 [Bradyrhizobium sp. CCBAU 11361]|nr:hypothetical protein [Bradyrhizobium sp. CCBAU 11361]
MLAWKSMKEYSDPLQTNYLQNDREVPDEDEDGEAKYRDVLRALNDGPSAEKMVSAFSNGIIFKDSYDTIICYTRKRDGTVATHRSRRAKLVPDLQCIANVSGVPPKIALSTEYKSAAFPGCLLRSVVRLGKVTFSDSDLGSKPLGSVLRWNIGQKKTGKPKGGSERFFPPPPKQYSDPLERLIAMEDAIAANDNLTSDQIKTLDAAITARNFADVGIAGGFTGKAAERQGKRLALEASKALSVILERLAA